ncbi:hypothetical protein FACS18947_0880 [Bacteroidia bacterium]|nr:hypothetical protein FACS18947_0880 [Bacteroidia bacterium]
MQQNFSQAAHTYAANADKVNMYRFMKINGIHKITPLVAQNCNTFLIILALQTNEKSSFLKTKIDFMEKTEKSNGKYIKTA